MKPGFALLTVLLAVATPALVSAAPTTRPVPTKMAPLLKIASPLTPDVPPTIHTLDSLSLAVGRSQVVTLPSDITKVSITDAAIADVAVLSKREVLVNGKAPGITSCIAWTKTGRKASTEVTLAPGQGLVIGGLLQTNETENIEKFPFLGEIPILGELFKSRRFAKQETELEILVTPKLI